MTKQPACGNTPALSRRAMLAAIPATAALPAAAMVTSSLPADLSAENGVGGTHSEQRIRQFCEWFDLEMPVLEYEDGDIAVTEELIEWVREAGVSLDWVFCGDVKSMAIAYRQDRQQMADWAKIIERFDSGEQKIMAKALRRHHEGRCSLDDALSQMTSDITTYRAGGAAA